MKIEIDTSQDWVCDFVAVILESDIKMLDSIIKKNQKKGKKNKLSQIEIEDNQNTMIHKANLEKALKFYKI